MAIATAGYGLLIVFIGAVGTHGTNLAFNLVAGAGFLTSAAFVWRLGRVPKTKTMPTASEANDAVLPHH